MKQRPIIFNTEMVRAILEGRKTQTRRALPKWQELKRCTNGNCSPYNWMAAAQRDRRYGFDCFGETEDACIKELSQHGVCPFGNVGDQLWVRETFQIGLCTKSTIAYKATHKPSDLEEGWDETIKWRPSIHMPRSASRILLEVTNVRIERLNDISKEDAKAEGCDYPAAPGMSWKFGARHNFMYLWNSIYNNWKSNPWVWVIEFKVVSTSEVAA